MELSKIWLGWLWIIFEQFQIGEHFLEYFWPTYSYNSIKRTCSIKRPGLEFFKKSLLNDQYDLKNEVLNS